MFEIILILILFMRVNENKQIDKDNEVRIKCGLEPLPKKSFVGVWIFGIIYLIYLTILIAMLIAMLMDGFY